MLEIVNQLSRRAWRVVVTIRLISFELCPFVQRSEILLRQKQVPHDLTFIDVEHPPEWFVRLSPTGKVPVLLVDDTVLFESSVILDYIEETHSPHFHPHDPLERAQHKAWIEYGSTLLMSQVGMASATDEAAYREGKSRFEVALSRMNGPLEAGLFGTGDRFSLVDAAFAPLFMRCRCLADAHPEGGIEMSQTLSDWAGRLLSLPSVQSSVVKDFDEKYRSFLRHKGSWLLSLGR
ncbi:MAG: glutathione S-transferase family protein [Candidatus Thiodiazotropha sp.]